MNDPAMKLAEEAIRIGATLLAQRDELAAKVAELATTVAELEASVLWWSNSAKKVETQRDEYRRALDDATAKYDAAMKVVTK